MCTCLQSLSHAERRRFAYSLCRRLSGGLFTDNVSLQSLSQAEQRRYVCLQSLSQDEQKNVYMLTVSFPGWAEVRLSKSRYTFLQSLSQDVQRSAYSLSSRLNREGLQSLFPRLNRESTHTFSLFARLSREGLLTVYVPGWAEVCLQPLPQDEQKMSAYSLFPRLSRGLLTVSIQGWAKEGIHAYSLFPRMNRKCQLTISFPGWREKVCLQSMLQAEQRSAYSLFPRMNREGMLIIYNYILFHVLSLLQPNLSAALIGWKGSLFFFLFFFFFCAHTILVTFYITYKSVVDVVSCLVSSN